MQERNKLERVCNFARSFCKKHKILEEIARAMVGTITHVYTQERVAALTFDDGPHPESTPAMLDLLGKHKVKATFFMVGEAAKRYPQIVHQVANAKHVIANHSFSHPSFPRIKRIERMKQVYPLFRNSSHRFLPPHDPRSLMIAWIHHSHPGKSQVETRPVSGWDLTRA